MYNVLRNLKLPQPGMIEALDKHGSGREKPFVFGFSLSIGERLWDQ
jgi:hypothetical protein